MASASERRAAAPSGPPAFADRDQAGLLLGAAVRAVLASASSRDSERTRAPSWPVPDSPGGRPARPRVFALPRGGVPVGAGVAGALGVPLDVLMVRKIGHPDAPELGLGAIAEDGAGGAAEPVFDQDMLRRAGLTPADLAGVVAAERAELARRAAVYTRGQAPGLSGGERAPGALGPTREAPAGRPLAVVVDDGLATGVTARAALRAVRARGHDPVVLAVPVAAPPAIRALSAAADTVVALVTPRAFRSVGEWYADFGQLTDDDVLAYL